MKLKNTENNKSIGIFDSGVGGLTVLKELRKILPNENIIYLGDNARNPYGSKSAEKVTQISLENSEFLLSQDVKMIIVACNTASAVALETLRINFDIPVIGVINGGVRATILSTKNKRVGVIGTRQTIASNIHKKLIQNIDSSIEVYTKATPLFAPLVEEGYLESRSADVLIEEELRYFKDKNIDTLILGCTHYPLLKEKIQAFLPNVTLIDPSEETSKEVMITLMDLNLENESKEITGKIFVTDRPLNFMEVSEKFLGSQVYAVEKVDLENKEKRSISNESIFNI